MAEAIQWDQARQYRRIFQSINADIYCNSEQHVRLAGGGFGSAPTTGDRGHAMIEIRRCNCRRGLHPAD